MQQPDPPLLIILDWMMPEMDGPEVMQRVRALPAYCPPYIIMLTVRGGNVDIVATLKAGADDYLTKPINRDEILARVEVGLRIIMRELVQFRLREKAQCYRVEATRRINELEDALASKEKELRQAQAALQALDASLLALR
jgi:DNA-binding response OmpR family regulator